MKLNPKWFSLGLSLLGVGGVGLTSWLSVKCHDKAKDKPDKKQKILTYAPAIASGVGTAACILGSHHISRKEIAALSASCVYLTANRDKILKKVKDTYGDEEGQRLIQEAGQETAGIELGGKNHTISIENTGRGNELFMDLWSGRVFRSSYANVVRGIRIFNNEFKDGGGTCFNYLYDLWGIAPTTMGDKFGWPYGDEISGYYSCDPSQPEPIRFDLVEVEDDTLGKMWHIYLDTNCEPIYEWYEY